MDGRKERKKMVGERGEHDLIPPPTPVNHVNPLSSPERTSRPHTTL